LWNGEIYYRLKQVDFNQEFEYSSIILVSEPIANGEIQVYPNPTNGSTWIQVSNDKISNVAISVTNMTGQVLMKFDHHGLIPNEVIPLNLSNFDRGLYYILIESGGVTQSKKLVVERH